MMLADANLNAERLPVYADHPTLEYRHLSWCTWLWVDVTASSLALQCVYADMAGRYLWDTDVSHELVENAAVACSRCLKS